MNKPSPNALLATLPPDLYERLSPEFETVTLPKGRVVHEQDQPIAHSYFPTAGVISMVLATDEGNSIEVAMAGREGMVGLPFVVGNLSPWQTLVQVPTTCLVIDTQALLDHAARNPELQVLLLRYMGFLHKLAAQNIACNRFHNMGQRTARWLLMVRDRADSDELAITQEFLARMLGVHRPNVTAVIGELKHAGLIIRTRRGRLAVVDNTGLEAAACECYEQIRNWTGRIAG